MYKTGDRVEVLDRTGKWRAGTVVKTLDPLVTVKRDDGQTRTISDRLSLRREGDRSDQLDFGPPPSPGYLIDVSTPITVPQFDVTIPSGSTSLAIERELEPITEEMNHAPLIVNQETWRKNLTETAARSTVLIAECRGMAVNKLFRPNASKDCFEEFVTERKLPVQRTSKQTGAPSIDKETLYVWATEFQDPLAAKTIEAREAMTCVSQLQAWEEYATAGWVQTKWNSLGTPHGRYTADSPCLTNRIVPIRETIEAHPGFQFISLDLGQAEYVTWASLSKDPVLTDIFNSKRDLHTEMAQLIRKLVPNWTVKPEEERAAGKTINFAILYRMQDFVLAKKLGCPIQTAVLIIESYKNRAAAAVNYMDQVLEEVKRTCRTATKYGRVRYMGEYKNYGTLRAAARHELNKTAWHHHNAGTAAEILKAKQVKTWKTIRSRGIGSDIARIALNMFDEVILEVREDHVDEVKSLALEVFQRPIPGFVPFKVDCRVGKNWKEISK